MRLIRYAAIALLPFALVSCGEAEDHGTPKFRPGQMVRMVAFGNEGMIVSGGCFRKQCDYRVRFSSIQIHTNTSLFGSDGPVDFVPVAIVGGIKEFELEARP